jgi:hypothetical protein
MLMSRADSAPPAAALAPVRAGKPDPMAALLFDTAGETRSGDPVARFLAEDAPALDWRHDFLRSEAMELIFELPRDDEEIDASELEVYSKSDVVTTGEAAAKDDSGS